MRYQTPLAKGARDESFCSEKQWPGNQKRKELAVYLQDHYAGAVAAIEMLEHLIKTHAGKPLERFFSKLHTDIRSDRRQLRHVMTILGFQKSTVRDTGAWMAEKLARTKLGPSTGKTVGLCLVESLEILQLGISGKRALWRVLSAVSKNSYVLQHTDFTALERRAVEQLGRVEAKRLEAARATFRPT